MTPEPVRLERLARHVGAILDDDQADGDVLVHGVVMPGAPRADMIVVCASPEDLRATLAAPGAATLAALLVAPDVEVPASTPAILRHDAPRLAFARLTALFDGEPRPAPGHAPTASVAASAIVADDATLAAHVVVADHAVIEAGCILGEGCIIGAGVRIGAGTRLFPNVTLYPGVRLGARVRIHAGAVLGGDGFGYVAGPEGAEKVHHLGTVEIEDDVEIGANTTIDRGTLGSTRIGAGSKIDNLCQIGHNVVIGRHTMMAAMVAIGGSTRIGHGVRIGGGARISDHLTLHDGSSLVGASGLSKDIPAGETWSGSPAAPMRTWLRERYLIGNLERMWSFVRTATRQAPGKNGKDT